jgi:glycosyltransferase involved in cell wall biosynthesis
MRESDPSLEIRLFHSRFDAEVPEPWVRDYTVESLPHGIRRLYPQWAVLRRPSLPTGLFGLDVVHTPSPAAVPPPGPGQRLVVTVHDLAFVVHPELFPRQWRLMYRAALSRAVRSADAIVTVSRHTAEDLVRHTRVHPSRIHVTHLGPSSVSGQAGIEETLARFRVRRPYALFVGTLEPRKNLVRLVRAYRRAASRGVRHTLVLAGPAGWRHEPVLAEASREGPGEVVLTGPTRTPEELDALYRGADLFVYPSLYEGFGLPVVEAMARGVPCVVSTSSSLPEVAGEAALLVDPRSVAALAEAIERVLGDPALAARLRELGPARAARFSWEATARQTIDVYRSLL